MRQTLSLAQALKSVAHEHSGMPALAGDGAEVTYAQLLDHATRIAGSIRSLSLPPSSRVALAFRNHPEFVPAYLGCSLAGMAPVAVYPDYGWMALVNIVCETGSRLVISDPTERTASVIGAARTAGSLPVPAVTLADLPAPRVPDVDEPQDPDATMIVLASSGTTGKPKLIGRSHRGFLAASQRFGELWGCHPGVRFGIASLITHAAALGWGVHPVLVAGGVLIVETDRRPENLLAAFARHDVEATFLVPSHARRLLRAVVSGSARAPDSLRLIILGGEPLDAALAEALHERFHCEIQDTYGMSEGFCTATMRGDLNEIRLGSVGRPCFREDEIRILTSDGKPVAPGMPGELWVRGPAIVRSYWNRAPDPATFSPDGFFRTGDRVCSLGDRKLRFVGRTSLMINRAGVKMSPEELEGLIMRLPGVEAVTVMGVADSETGQRICAVLQTRSGFAGYTLSGLREALSTVGAGKAILPDQLELVDELPTSPVGKVDRRAVFSKFEVSMQLGGM